MASPPRGLPSADNRDVKKVLTFKLPSERKEDAFDKDDFDVTKFINQMYPDESSLSDIDRFAGALKKQASTIPTQNEHMILMMPSRLEAPALVHKHISHELMHAL